MVGRPAGKRQIAGGGHGFGSISRCTWAASGTVDRARIRMRHRVRLYHACGVFLIAFAGGSLRSQSAGKPFNVGIQAEESFSSRRLESRLTSSASLRCQHCCLRSPDASCAKRVDPGICRLPTVEVLKVRGNRMTIKCHPSASCSSRESQEYWGYRYQPEIKNPTKLPAFSAGFRFNPGPLHPSHRFSSCLAAL
jgi:hypothetical protein